MPEQSTRISGRYVRTSFRLILSPPWFLFLKLTRIFLIRGLQWIHTSGNNRILNIAVNSDAPLHSWNERINLHNQSGLIVGHAKAKALCNVQWEIIEEAFRHSVQNRIPIQRQSLRFAWMEECYAGGMEAHLQYSGNKLTHADQRN